MNTRQKRRERELEIQLREMIRQEYEEKLKEKQDEIDELKKKLIEVSTKQKVLPLGHVYPPEVSYRWLFWGAGGGQQLLPVTNNSTKFLALKMKCSDNKLFIINPVFTVLHPCQTIQITVTRLPGPAKMDKIVICSASCEIGTLDVAEFFKRDGLIVETENVAMGTKEDEKKMMRKLAESSC